jgi:hypothetical protein
VPVRATPLEVPLSWTERIAGTLFGLPTARCPAPAATTRAISGSHGGRAIRHFWRDALDVALHRRSNERISANAV